MRTLATWLGLGLGFFVAFGTAQAQVSDLVEPAPEAAPTSVAPAAQDEPGSLFSAEVPRAGDFSFGLGGRVFVLIPMLSANASLGLGGRVALDLRASVVGTPLGDGAAVGIAVAEPGLRVKLAENERGALALRASTTLIQGFGVSQGESGTGGTGFASLGLLATRTKEKRRLTAGLEIPVLYTVGGVGVSSLEPPIVNQAPAFGIGVSPSFGLERRLRSGRDFYFQVQMPVILDQDLVAFPLILPNLNTGVSW